MTAQGNCRFCDHALDGQSKRFCTTCLPPLGQWRDKRSYHRRYMLLRSITDEGVENGAVRTHTPIPPHHPAWQQPPKPPRHCGCGTLIESGTMCEACRTQRRSAGAKSAWARKHASWQIEGLLALMAGCAIPRYYDNHHKRRSLAERRARAQRSSDKPTAARLAQRDGWTCHICGKAVDPDLIGSMNKYRPIVDHLVPISQGGTDDMANARLAHLRCNAKRGTGGTVQLMLVG